MPIRKTFKRRVRARMAKTTESYTAARHQLLRRRDQTVEARDDADPAVVAATADTADPTGAPPSDGPAAPYTTSEDAVIRATGRSYPEWFAVLDAWGASERRHGEIASWLSAKHGVPAWWTQAVTVSYERARGLRSVHEMKDGYTVGVTRTMSVTPDAALAAFTDPSRRRRWLGDVELTQRRTTAAGSARFDWPDPPSRLVVYAEPKASGRTLVSVAHERLPDAQTAAREKAAWKDRLIALKALLET